MTRLLSPLRYPGGKSKLFRFLSSVIYENSLNGCTYIEPYAGGSGLALALLGAGWVSKITLNDADPIIYKFWKSVLGNSDELCKLVSDTPVTLETWYKQKEVIENASEHDDLEIGFATFFLNRTNRSGIIKGAGVIGGYSQKGNYLIDARYYRETMINRIEAIAKISGKIKFFNKDAIAFCGTHVSGKNTLTYLDPPYYEKGHRLYRNFYKPSDHLTVQNMVRDKLKGHWVVSYDNAPEIRAIYDDFRPLIYTIPHTATVRRQGQEAIFFSDDLIIPDVSKPMVRMAA